MRKIFFVIVSILIITLLGWYFFWQKQIPANAPEDLVVEEPKTEKAWVEVVNRGVYLIDDEDETLEIELKTGDEVESGQTIMTDQVGLVNLHFSDGSVARLESQTKVELKDFIYFSENKTLQVKIFLQSGRIWSRIKALMTTESYWEVETTNAVAAVRGTSYGVVYIPGQTTIIGSVHLINVNAKNLETQKSVENNIAYVGENQYLIINDQDINNFIAGVKLNEKVKPYSIKIKDDPWVIQSKEKDTILEGQVKPEIKPEINNETPDKSEKEKQMINTTTENSDSLDNQNSVYNTGDNSGTIANPEEETNSGSNYSEDETNYNDVDGDSLNDKSPVYNDNPDANNVYIENDTNTTTTDVSSTGDNTYVDTIAPTTTTSSGLLDNYISHKVTTTTPTSTVLPIILRPSILVK